MIEANLTDHILDALAAVSGHDEVRTDLDLPLFEREVMDSMRTVEFIVALEEQFGVQISPAELDREMWATPRKIIADVERRLK
jgi:D-alanine--poly(phosphoribitol) ligase subunit 2